MKKTLLASAVLFALSGPSIGADFIHKGNFDLANPPSDFDETSIYDRIEITNVDSEKREYGPGLRPKISDR